LSLGGRSRSGAQVTSWISSENHRSHSSLQAHRANPLDHAQDGQGAGSPRQHCGANLAGARTQTSPAKELQTVTGPKFVEKLLDVVGIYLNPPQHAVVLCVDEKSQIQALDRTQPGLPLKKGRCGTWTHDYVRHGTTTLFAALNAASGKVSGECYPHHRHQEFIKFLR